MKPIIYILLIFSPTLLIGQNFFGLLAFDCNQINNNIEITWVTSFETNTDYFVIERSLDSLNFSPIDTINAAGNSTNLLFYNTIDQGLFSDTCYYYQLKGYYFDSTSDSSIIRKVCYSTTTNINKHEKLTDFTIYPNPLKDIGFLELEKWDNISYTIIIYDINGRIIRQINDISSRKIKIEKGNLESGLYIVYYRDNIDNIIIKKLIVE